jgi:uncharacterized membrane protein
MIICQQCGATSTEAVAFCQQCGASFTTTAQRAQPAQAYATQPVDAQTDAEQNKAMAILAYFIWFIPLIAGAHKTSPFARFHTNQGLLNFLLALAYSIVYMILTGILGAIFLSTLSYGAWGAYGVLTMLLSLLFIVPGIFAILGIVNAATGKMKPLPIIGKFTIIK